MKTGTSKIRFAGQAPGQRLSGIPGVASEPIDGILFAMEILDEPTATGEPEIYVWIYTTNGEKHSPLALFSDFSDFDEVCAAIIAKNNAPSRGQSSAKPTVEFTNALTFPSHVGVDQPNDLEESGVPCSGVKIEGLTGCVIASFLEPTSGSDRSSMGAEIFFPIDRTMVDRIVAEFDGLRVARAIEFNRLHALRTLSAKAP